MAQSLRTSSPLGVRVVEVLPPLVDTPATRAVTQPKMSAGALVERVLRDIDHGRDEILPGNVGLLPFMMRLAPKYVWRVALPGREHTLRKDLLPDHADRSNSSQLPDQGLHLREPGGVAGRRCLDETERIIV